MPKYYYGSSQFPVTHAVRILVQNETIMCIILSTYIIVDCLNPIIYGMCTYVIFMKKTTLCIV